MFFLNDQFAVFAQLILFNEDLAHKSIRYSFLKWNMALTSIQFAVRSS